MFLFTQCLEWCTLLPSPDGPRKSPVFILQGNEWYFNFLYEEYESNWYFDVYLELHNKHTEIKGTSVKFQVGFENENNLSLETDEFNVSEHREVWYMKVNDLQSMLPSDYLDGNWIKFKFFFNDVDEAHLKIKKETDDKAVQTPPYIDAIVQLEAVSKDFSDLLDAGPNHDVEFLCGDETIKAHKDVVCCRSTVFASMLGTDMQEGKTGKIKIQDMESSILNEFLRYLYTGMLPNLTFDSSLCIYQAADKYAVDSLKKQCASFLIENLSHENACEVLILSDRHNDSVLKNATIDYMLKEEIPQRIGGKWNDFSKDNLALANEVLYKLYMKHYRTNHVSEKQ